MVVLYYTNYDNNQPNERISESEYPRRSGNYGLGDLVTALTWVRDNVLHFGGDPDAVTLLGHGAGASLATAVTAVNQADGLYHRLWATGLFEYCY